MDIMELCQLLGSPNKVVRQEAEARYLELRQGPTSLPQLLRGLLLIVTTPSSSLINASSPPEHQAAAAQAKIMACILLRQNFDPNIKGGLKSIETLIDPSLLLEVRQILLAAVANEPEKNYRNKLCHTLAQVATALPTGTEWPELLQLTAHLMNAGTPQHRETGYELLDKIAEYKWQLLVPFAGQLPVALQSGLEDGTSPAVRLAALKATCSVTLEMGKANDANALAAFRPLIGPLLKVLAAALHQQGGGGGQEEEGGQQMEGGEEAACEAIAALTKLTEEVPKFWRESLDEVGPLLVAIIRTSNDDGMDAAIRIAAIEWASTLAEKCPARFRRAEWLANALIPALMELISTPPPEEEGGEEAAAWAQRADSPESFADLHDGEEEEEGLADAAAMALDRLSHALGGKVMYKAVLPLLLAGLQDGGNWTRRRGALLALAMMTEGCDTALHTHLPELMPFLIQFVADPHPRVRYASLVCLTRLCEDLGEGPSGDSFQKLYAHLVLPGLAASLAESVNQSFPRILATAAAGVTSFCDVEKCTSKVIGAHLEPLLRALFHVLERAPLFVKEEAMTGVATLAHVSQEKFLAYYDTFVPVAKAMLAESTRESDGTMGLLGLKALEAFALMGDAVGRDKFRQDAHEVLRLVADFHKHHHHQVTAASLSEGGGAPAEVSDPQAAFIMNSTARIGSALGREFAPYLEGVLPLVLAAAAKRPEYKVRTAEEGIDATVEEDEDDKSGKTDQRIAVETRGGGKYEIRVNSWEVQQREIACQSLLHYVEDLGSCLKPYWATIFQVVVDLISPMSTPDVRICAYGILPKLLRIAARTKTTVGTGAAAGEGEGLVEQAFNEAVRRLLAGLIRESDLVEDEDSEDMLELLCVGADTLAMCLQVSSDSQKRDDWVTLNLADDLVQPVFELIQKLMVGTIRRRIALQQDTEVLDAEDEDLLERREEWEQGLLNSCQEAVGWVLRSKDAVPCFQAVLDPLVAPLLSVGNALELRLLGLCIYIDVLEYGGPLGVGVAPAVLPLAAEFLKLEDEDARQTGAYGVGVLGQFGGETLDPSGISTLLPDLLGLIVQENCVADNAISSVLRLCRYRSHALDSQRLLHGGVLDRLPLKEDLREGHSCHAHFVEWVKSDVDAHLLFGPQKEYLASIVSVLARLMVDPRTHEERIAEARLVDDGDEEEEEDSCFEEQYVSKQTRKDIEGCLVQLQSLYPEKMAEIFASLSEEQKVAVQTPTDKIFRQTAQ